MGISEFKKEIMGSNCIYLTGGEPLLHPEFDKFVDESSKVAKRVVLQTNGSLIKERLVVDTGKKLSAIQISIPSFSREGFFRLRGADAFDDIIESIRFINEYFPHIWLTLDLLATKSMYESFDVAKEILSTVKYDRITLNDIFYIGAAVDNAIFDEVSIDYPSIIGKAVDLFPNIVFSGFPMCIDKNINPCISLSSVKTVMKNYKRFEDEHLGNGSRVKPDFCSGCSAYRQCQGVETLYLEKYGGAGFHAI